MPIKVLIVDDEPNIRSLLTSFFQTMDSDVLLKAAGTNSEALAHLKVFTPDLITTDIMRPGGTGTEFLLDIRRTPHTKRTPVLAITGQVDNEAEELHLYRQGFNGVLVKPFLLTDLFKLVERLVPTETEAGRTLLRGGYEHPSIDYKEKVDVSCKEGRAALAKDVIAMANWGGGTIIVGVEETAPGSFRAKGVEASSIGALETTKLNKALRAYLDPPLHVTVRAFHEDGRTLIQMDVPPADKTLVLAKKQNLVAKLFPGRIYTRTSAAETSEVTSASELRDILDRVMKRKAEDSV